MVRKKNVKRCLKEVVLEYEFSNWRSRSREMFRYLKYFIENKYQEVCEVVSKFVDDVEFFELE